MWKFFFFEKIKLDISRELSALIKFYFFSEKLNTLTLLELYFTLYFPCLEMGFSE